MKSSGLNENLTSRQSGRVMIVDDHRQARESMADVLRAAGHEVLCCSSGPEALQVLEQENFECIVTDLKMPGMNGVELIMHIEQRRLCAQVVMVTAHASVATAVEAMRHGAFDYIEKPFNVDQLERLVGQAIRHGRLVKEEPRDGSRKNSGDPPVMIGCSGQMQMLRADRAGCSHAGNGIDHRRKRHRQGIGGAGNSRGQRTARRRTSEPELPGAFGPIDGERTVRARARCIHRR